MDMANNNDANNVEPMLLQVGIDHSKNTSNALLDSGAGVNVMSKHIYKKFVNKALSSTTHRLNTFLNQAVNCKGVIFVALNVGTYKDGCLFYVIEDMESAHNIILGRVWIHKHRCQLD